MKLTAIHMSELVLHFGYFHFPSCHFGSTKNDAITKEYLYMCGHSCYNHNRQPFGWSVIHEAACKIEELQN